MNVFVLCTGRCGSTTFARACRHMTNYGVGHESRIGKLGEERLAFPPDPSKQITISLFTCRDAALEMVETATANIRHFLKDKTSVAHVRLEHADQDFPVSCDLVGADGSLEDALSEWRVSPHLYRRGG
jgi:hypothetical protein